MDETDTLLLRDIHLPGSPDFWPLAIGWWLLLTIVFFISFWLYLKISKQIKIKKQQAIIFKQLKKLEEKLHSGPDNETLSKYNVLLRQLSIANYPRTEVANLTGAEWLAFLDRSGETHEFSRGAGRILVDAPYQSGELQNFNIDEFIPLIRKWISKVHKRWGGVI